MAKTTLYAGVLAKIGAERSNLLSENKFRALTEAKTFTAFAAQLRESNYQQQIAKMPLPITSRKMERAFTENLIDTYIKIIKNSPKGAAAFLRLYLLRFEVENIKALVNAANAEFGFEEKLSRIYLSPEIYLKRRTLIEEAAKAVDIKQTVSALKKTEYASTLDMGLRSFDENGSITCLNVLLDKHFYEKLSDAYQNLPKKEQSHAAYYVSKEVDSFILLTLLRGKNLNYDPNWLRLAVPSKKFNLSEETVEAIVTATDFGSAQKIAFESYYGRFFVKAQTPEQTIANAEKAFKKDLFEHAKESRFTEIFNIGGVMAFLVQKEAEVHNLTVLSLGAEVGLKLEDMQAQLLV